VTAVHRRFVLPVSLHRWMNRPELTKRMEAILAGVGFTRWFGNPITVRAVRAVAS
jgi:hypothetical protein